MRPLRVVSLRYTEVPTELMWQRVDSERKARISLPARRNGPEGFVQPSNLGGSAETEPIE